MLFKVDRELFEIQVLQLQRELIKHHIALSLLIRYDAALESAPWLSFHLFQRREGDADCTKVSINLKGMVVAIVLYFIFGKFNHLRSPPTNPITTRSIFFIRFTYLGTMSFSWIGWNRVCFNESFTRYRTPVVKGKEVDWRENLVSRM